MATYSSASLLSGYPGTCIYPDCSKPKYVEHNGRIHDFCGRTHAVLYRVSIPSLRSSYSSSPAPVTTTTAISPRQSADKYSSRTTPSFISTTKSLPFTIHSFMNKFTPDPKTIYFYESHKPYYEFTNFYPSPIIVDGSRWPTSEHYFQAQKFIGTPYYDYIRTSLPAPRDAFQFSRDPQVSKWERRDWYKVKDDVMLKVLSAKFTQDEYLKKKLLDTKDKELVAHTSNDSYWGDGGDGSGQNKLGKLLMKVRDVLQEKEKLTRPVTATSSLRRSSSFSDLSSLKKHSNVPPAKFEEKPSLMNTKTNSTVPSHGRRRSNSITAGSSSFLQPQSLKHKTTSTTTEWSDLKTPAYYQSKGSTKTSAASSSSKSNVHSLHNGGHLSLDTSHTTHEKQKKIVHIAIPTMNRRTLNPAVTKTQVDNNTFQVSSSSSHFNSTSPQRSSTPQTHRRNHANKPSVSYDPITGLPIKYY